MGIKELELFTIKIGYSLLVISSNYFFALGPLRWRAAHLPCWGPAAEPTAGDLLPLACGAAVLPLGTCRREPAVPLTCEAAVLPPGTYRRSPAVPPLTCRREPAVPGTCLPGRGGYFAKLTERVSRITVIFTWPG